MLSHSIPGMCAQRGRGGQVSKKSVGSLSEAALFGRSGAGCTSCQIPNANVWEMKAACCPEIGMNEKQAVLIVGAGTTKTTSHSGAVCPGWARRLLHIRSCGHARQPRIVVAIGHSVVVEYHQVASAGFRRSKIRLWTALVFVA